MTEKDHITGAKARVPLEPLVRLYAKRNHRRLDPYFSQHMDAMTGEGLHEKSEIAAELAYRDMEIARLRSIITLATERLSMPPKLIRSDGFRYLMGLLREA